MKKYIIFFVCFTFLGCAYTQHTKLTETEYEPTENNIEIATEGVDKPYLELAIIQSEGWTINQSKESIVKKAKKLGADAVIKFQCNNGASVGGVAVGSSGTNWLMGGGSPNCTGLAIKYKN